MDEPKQVELTFVPLTEDDLEPLVQEMARMNATIAGLGSPSAFRTLLRDALRATDITVVVARDGLKPIGLVFAVTDWAKYKRGFARRYPNLGVQLVKRRLSRMLRRNNHALTGQPSGLDTLVLDRDPYGARWGDPSHHIATTVFIGVTPDYRGRRIVPQLYESLGRLLRARGVRRLDARMHPGNLASIKAHVRSGWRVSWDGTGIFATTDLTNDDT